jgi:hypothetical protein
MKKILFFMLIVCAFSYHNCYAYTATEDIYGYPANCNGDCTCQDMNLVCKRINVEMPGPPAPPPKRISAGNYIDIWIPSSSDVTSSGVGYQNVQLTNDWAIEDNEAPEYIIVPNTIIFKTYMDWNNRNNTTTGKGN